MKKLYFLLTGLFIAGLGNIGYSQYCTPSYSYACSSGDYINNFSTSGGSTNITNNNSGCSGSNWGVFTSMVHTVEWLGTVNISVQAGSSWGQGHRIYVDWNQDGDFFDAGEDVWNSGGSSTATFTGSFNVPATALAGSTRMRVRCRYAGVPSSPCNNESFGEVEDYTLTILPPVANDAGIASIISPSIPTCDLDSVDITVAVQNLGSDTLQNCSIYYTINAGTPVSMYYTGSVAPQGGLDTVTIDNVNFSNGDDLLVWTELPNGVQDSLPTNDEASLTTATGLSGTYAIPGDYATINDAADDLHAFGVCDHVVFNLATGTYTEQVSFNDIAGTSDSATVTFQSASGNTNDVLIQFDASSLGNNYVVQFNGGDWITFKDLRMKSLEQYTYGCVLNVKSGSNNNTIDNCWLKGNSYQTTSQYTANILWEGSSDGFTLTDSRIENGAQSMYMISGNTADPSEDMTITNNMIKNALYYQMYMYAVDGFVLDNNTITNDSALYSSGYGYYQLYMYAVNNMDITRNYIGHDVGYGYYYPVYFNNCVGRNNPRSQVSNNCIFAATDGATSYNYYATYMYNSGVMDVHNNSITRRGGFGGTYPALYINQGGLISLKNNSIANMTGGYALQVTGGFSVTESDYNNLYTTSGSPVYYNTTAYSSLEAYSDAVGYDENSVSTDPNFQTSLTCITCNDTLSDAGTPVAMTTEDILGNTRSLSTPDIGPVEFVNANSFDLGPNDTLCGNEVTIEAGPAQSVAWGVSENGGTTQTYTTSSIDLMASGGEPSEFEVNVVISTEYCGNASDEVTIYLVPDATLDSSMHICADETATLAPGGGNNATYTWASGETTPSIEVSEAGTYSVTKMEEGCESEASIMVTKSAAVEIADVEGCEDDAPLSVDASIVDGASYAWSGGSSINTAANEFSTAGSYSVTATDIHGCVSTSDFDLFILGEPTADISFTGSAGTAFLFSSTGSTNTSPNTSYLWTFNGIDTSSAANPVYQFPWNGNPTTYPVSLVIDNGCGQDLDELDITVDPLSVGDVDVVEFAVYPNPTTGVLNISLGDNIKNEGTIEVMDLSGRVLSTEIVTDGQNVAVLDLSDLASGSYLIKVSTDGTSSVSSFVKQ